MKTKTKFGLMAAGAAVLAGVGILLLSTDKGKKIRKEMKKKAKGFFDEVDDMMTKTKAKFAEVQEQLQNCENKAK